jgi:hypothetical protein
MSLSWHPVLNSPIPQGFYGRNLTSTECKALRALGVRCSERYIVTRHAESAHYGIIYKPSHQGSGFDNTGVTVQEK